MCLPTFIRSMSWSLGEAKSLSIKAARGAGFNWGVAEEVGAAVTWLHASGAPGVAALVQHLEWRESNSKQLSEVSQFFQPTLTQPNLFCPIALGCAIQDHGAESLTQLEQAQIRQPLLLIPFLAALDQQLTVTWNKCAVAISPRSMVCNETPNKLLIDQAQCSISSVSIQHVASLQTRVPVGDKHFIKKLETYAGKTYAPATEASRLAGAGAGLTDND